MTENHEGKALIQGLLNKWSRFINDKKEAERNLNETRSAILELMDKDKMDVDNYHLVKVKNWGINTDRDKNKREGKFTWVLHIRDKA